jgi:hypothetical protein
MLVVVFELSLKAIVKGHPIGIQLLAQESHCKKKNRLLLKVGWDSLPKYKNAFASRSMFSYFYGPKRVRSILEYCKEGTL